MKLNENSNREHDLMDELAREIFMARHYGNVSPEEFMVPYPGISELVYGQNIKHGAKVVYTDRNITNRDILERSGRIANWLMARGVRSGDRIHVHDLEGPDALFFAFGIWMTGAVLVIGESAHFERLDLKLDLERNTIPDSKTLASFSQSVTIPETHNLNDEALIIARQGRQVRLSHYNLLVNSTGVQRLLSLGDTSTISVKTREWTLPWIILYTIMPLTCGCMVSSQADDSIRIGALDDEHCDFRIIEEWNAVSAEKPPGIFFLDEAGGALSVGTEPVPLLKYTIEAGWLKFQGHSVMMGYTRANQNAEVFRNGWARLLLGSIR